MWQQVHQLFVTEINSTPVYTYITVHTGISHQITVYVYILTQNEIFTNL